MRERWRRLDRRTKRKCRRNEKGRKKDRENSLLNRKRLSKGNLLKKKGRGFRLSKRLSFKEENSKSST